MHNLELLFEEKDKYQNSGRDILSKQKVAKNIETMINKIDDDMKILEKELFFQKKKKSPDVKQKEDIMKLLKNKFLLLKNKSKPKEEEENYQEEKAQNLDDFLQKIENNKNSNSQVRDIYEEEDEKIKEWNYKKQKEDEMFDEISGLVKGMNLDAKSLGMTIDEMRKKTQKMKNQFDNVYDNTKKQTQRIDKLNKKI